MASKIFKQIFERNISQFVGLFAEDSTAIFKDEQNKLIHPGEYGKYREDACKALLRLILDKHVNISDGFVITSNDGITTQCDIIVFNSNTAPFITDGIAKMFPAEEVRMIGEIKSTLSRKEYIAALRKMAENKRIILEGRQGTAIKANGRAREEYNTVVSFLICNKLRFDFDKLPNEEIYTDIDRKYWHNMILSIEDATISYLLKFEDFPQKIKDKLKKGRIRTNVISSFQYPFIECEGEKIKTDSNHVHIKRDDKYAHIKRFCIDIANCSKDIWIYTYDPVVYLGVGIDSIYDEGEGDICIVNRL